MTTDDPIERAKSYTDKLVGLVIKANAANENMRFAVYSPHLAQQIPRSHAAHAFMELQDTLLYYSVVRVCALFDKPSKDRMSLHTVVHALGDEEAVRRIAIDTYHYHATQAQPRRRKPETDPETRRLLTEHWQRFHEERGRREERLVHRRVHVARKIVERAERRFIKDHLRPFRDNFIAHNLADSARPGKVTFILGMEDRALRHAKCAVDLLHLALNGTSFSWADMEEQHQRNAREFWNGLTYTLPK